MMRIKTLIPCETDEQIAFFEYTQYRMVKAPGTGVFVPIRRYTFAIPNGGSRRYIITKKGRRISPEGMRLKKAGVKAGVSDVECIYPSHGYNGLFLEFKRNDGNADLTELQHAFFEVAAECNFMAIRVRGAQEGIDAMEGYLA
jgi:hypothetical protein